MASSEIGPGPQRSPKAALAAVALGILLVGLSFLPALAGQRERWTKEQATAYQDASMKIQQLTHELGNQSPDTASRAKEAEFQQAINRFQDLRTELNEARADRRLGENGAPRDRCCAARLPESRTISRRSRNHNGGTFANAMSPSAVKSPQFLGIRRLIAPLRWR